MKKDDTEIKRLYRSGKDKIIAGVCGGIAEYFNVDPILIRLAFLLLTFLNGVGIIFYIIAWILIPQNPNRSNSQTIAEETMKKMMKKINYKSDKGKPQSSHSILGIIFILIGIAFLFKYTVGWFNFNFVWPSIIILLGVYLIWRGFDG